MELGLCEIEYFNVNNSYTRKAKPYKQYAKNILIKNDGFSSFFVFFVLCIILQPIRFKYKSVEILLSITEVYKYLIDTGLNFFYFFFSFLFLRKNILATQFVQL